MEDWASLYANLQKNAPALSAAAAATSSSTAKRSRSTLDLRERTIIRRESLPPSPMSRIDESESESESGEDQDEDEDDIELSEVLQGAKVDGDNRRRKYATVTHLHPPKPFLHRNPNEEGRAERERLRKYATDPMRRSQSQMSSSSLERYTVRPLSLSRLASLPPMNSPPASPTSSLAPVISKPRKAKPAPLELVPHFTAPFLSNDSPTSSPYSSSSLRSLYSPRPVSPNSRTLSLPSTFQPADLPTPGRVRISNPLPISSRYSTKSTKSASTTGTSSPRNSMGSNSSASSASSTSSVDLEETWCEMPVPPTPTAVAPTRRDKIYNSRMRMWGLALMFEVNVYNALTRAGGGKYF